MANVKRYYARRGMILGIVLFLGLIICQSGCAYWIHLDITEDQKPVTLFDRYELDIVGHGIDDSLFNVSVHLDFINAITDTMNIADIPILMIDTICFEFELMDNTSCIGMLTSLEADKKLLGDGVIDKVRQGIRDDLRYSGGELQPLGFEDYPQRAYIPKQCQFADAIFTARLIDRVTGKEIARETKTVRFSIDRRYRLRSVS
jgi:hypothetical protein